MGKRLLSWKLGLPHDHLGVLMPVASHQANNIVSWLSMKISSDYRKGLQLSSCNGHVYHTIPVLSLGVSVPSDKDKGSNIVTIPCQKQGIGGIITLRDESLDHTIR